jgi:tetratricopeptide (TPR) repeat protein
MRIDEPRRLFLPALLLLIACSRLTAQTNADASDRASRQKAMALFTEGKRLEALPLLEDLALKNPKDDQVLVALAASLVEHAATLTDAGAAAQERFRARDLLQRAWGLGNTSPLAENLRQLLEELPASGAIKFSDNPAVQQAMNAGEAAFARRQFDEALKEYGRALELDPSNYSAALFTGNTYDKQNNFLKAGEWYDQAAKIDPNAETAYRYHADMLAKRGDMAGARSMLIQAAVAEPYNKIVWREIRAWATINHTAFNIVFVAIPLPQKAVAAASKQAAELLPAWRTYYAVKEEWKKGGRFQKQFPQEPEYRHSLPEESAALAAAAQALDRLKQDPTNSAQVASDPSASLLLKVRDAGLLDAYVLFSLGDDGIAHDYSAYRSKNRDKLETFMDKFVMPPAPPKQ